MAGAETTSMCTDLIAVFVIIKLVFTVMQFVVPAVLIILGSVDLVKAVTQGKEEEIKKGQKTLITRAIAAVIFFLIPLIVRILMGLIGSSDWTECWENADGQSIGDLIEQSVNGGEISTK